MSSEKMTLVSATAAGCQRGPVPFKDVAVVAGDAHRPSAEGDEDFDEAIAALPSKPPTPLMRRMRLYHGGWFPEKWLPYIMAFQRRFEARREEGDVIVASLPKCGTTWLKALAFATAARGTYPPPPPPPAVDVGGDDGGDRRRLHPLLRLNPHDCVPFLESIYSSKEDEAKLAATPSPRLLSTHLPYSVLPASITGNPNCKIIYVCRQPKDMLISFWHFVNRDKSRDVPLSYVWESVRECTYFGSPVWDHIIGYWNASKARPCNVLVLRYEDMKRDPARNVERIAEFIGQPFSEAEREAGVVSRIVELCSFETMKALGTRMAGSSQRVVSSEFPNDSFFRKGAIGDWVNHVTPDMAESLDKLLSERFDGSDFTFA
ncbi:cytosolic sulfotransferase 1-like [Oryza brachyantha]|uniref:Sulfotransferase n=1 Tax=Oryza brachyantha TaxID=4533 RepID=J3N1F9_ORYBR|nr:cytosolic sulfotransferase 1-like [Oryza brachyantha]